MNYWMTTQWPPNRDEDLNTYVPRGIWLPNGREQAGADIEIGDRVLIYQSKTGRSEIQNVKGRQVIFRPGQGREGIIAITEISGEFMARQDSKPSKYTRGPDIWWRWNADTQPISMNGFVPREKVNKVLGYKKDNPFRGFGDLKSGLKKLTKGQYDELVGVFKEHPREETLKSEHGHKGTWAPHDQGVESEEHKNLKNLVASNPSTILNEPGLKTLKVEYGFVSGDKADIVFEDGDGRIVGAEIELSVGDNIAGILQAIKYRYMLALTEERRNFETRAFLIANSVSASAKTICDKYEVEYFEVPNRKV